MYSNHNQYELTISLVPFVVTTKKGEKSTKVKPDNLRSRRTIDSELTENAIEFMKRNVKDNIQFFVFATFTILIFQHLLILILMEKPETEIMHQVNAGLFKEFNKLQTLACLKSNRWDRVLSLITDNLQVV